MKLIIIDSILPILHVIRIIPDLTTNVRSRQAEKRRNGGDTVSQRNFLGGLVSASNELTSVLFLVCLFRSRHIFFRTGQYSLQALQKFLLRARDW